MDGAAAPTYEVSVEHDVPMPMRDGTILRADVYRPTANGAWPVLLERTPYNKRESSEVSTGSPTYFASRGYAVVIQDVRGRFASDGEFYPFRDDGWGVLRDGYDTVEWIAAQPWCDGKVGTIGGSYSGATQYRMAPTRPPHLAAQFVRESSSDYHAEWTYRGGALELGFALRWAFTVVQMDLRNLVPGAELERRQAVFNRANEEVEGWLRHRPLNPCPPLVGLAEWWHDWLDHPDDGPYWWQFRVADQHHNVDVPIYHLGGWFDGFLRGTLENYRGIRARGGERARATQKLIVGPWIHGPRGMLTSTVGEFDFGESAAIDVNALRQHWFDHWLKGIDTGVVDEPPVRFFTMGSNEWQTASDWPPPGYTATRFYLRGGRSGSGASLNDGTLSREAPDAAESPDSYRYDPADPVPTHGGAHLGTRNGPYDQRPIEPRILTYTSERLGRRIEMTGQLSATIRAMSTALDTDWIVSVSDVHPDGTSRLVADGILRARFRHSQERPTPLVPNQVETFEIDLWGTSNLFEAGHRIRVGITSSNFPRFDANLNTGGPFGREARGVVALNTVFHDAFRPSFVTLPIRER